MSNKVEKAVKKKKNMLVKSIRWTLGGMIVGFLLTLTVSGIEAYKTGLLNALTNLVTDYFNLILNIADRNPGFADFILRSQALAEGQVYQSLSDTNSFIQTHFTGLANHPITDRSLSAALANVKYHAYGIAYLIEWSFKLDVVKFISVFCSVFVFIFAGFLGLIDGLLNRYIRTAEGGRESTYVYHHLAEALFKIPFCLVVAYLALPFPLNPMIVVVILTLTTFLFCRISAANLKKFI